MADDLLALELWAEPLLQGMTAGERVALARKIGTALRRSQHQRIQQQRNPDGSTFVPRKRARDKAGKIKRKADKMFQRISRSEHLRIQASETGVAVGFTGRIARIAGIHQRGETDRVSPGGPSVRYPTRELLGLTSSDRDMIREMTIDHLGA